MSPLSRRTFLAGLAAAPVLSACGGGGDDDDAAASTTTEEPSTTEAPSTTTTAPPLLAPLLGQPQDQRAAHGQAHREDGVAPAAQVVEGPLDLAVPVREPGLVHVLPARAVAGQAGRADRQAGRGEVLIGISFAHDIVKYAKEGMPLDVTFPKEGTGYEIGGIALINGAPDEEAAKILTVGQAADYVAAHADAG